MINNIEVDKIERRIKWLKELFYQPVQEVELEIAETESYLPKEKLEQLKFSPIQSGTAWGQEWGSAWFKGCYFYQKGGEETKLFLKVETGGESIVYVDGKAVGAIDRQHKVIPLRESELESCRHEILIQSYAGHQVPDFTPRPRDINSGKQAETEFLYKLPPVFQNCQLVLRNEPAWNLYYDLATLFGVANNLPAKNLRRNEILKSLSRALEHITWETQDKSMRNRDFSWARERIKPELAKTNSSTIAKLNLIGHAHVDIAWLWPIAETIRKCGRTFATQLRMLDEYPEYIFFQSQAQTYKFTEENYPGLFSQIKKAIKSGKWEVEGGTWVEPDTNIPATESLIRQFVFGKKYFREKFDVTSKILWLPDVFGYNGNLPQIMKGCGVDYFVTSKIGWNDTNRFPYDLFRWQGIDGSEVLTHFIKSTYNGRCDPDSVDSIWQEFNQPEHSDKIIHAVGYGDGGGGITMEHLEYARRQKDLEGQRKVKFGKVDELMEYLAERKSEYPEWRGELYLEYHRGTFTTQAWTKRNNRKLELFLRNAEITSVLASFHGFSYPLEKLRESWQKVLTNQFHDILPGTSIGKVYQDCIKIYGEVAEDLDIVINQAQSFLVRNESDLKMVTAWNTLGQPRRDLISISLNPNDKNMENKIGDYFLNQTSLRLEPGDEIRVFDEKGEQLVSQTGENKVIFSPGEVGPLKGRTFVLEKITELSGRENENSARLNFSPVKAKKMTGEDGLEYLLSNDFIEVILDNKGRLQSFYHKKLNRELILENEPANKLILAEDLPRQWDAWDIERYYREKAEEILVSAQIEIAAAGPLEARIKVEKEFGESSSLSQEIVLRYNSSRLDFNTKVNWQESHSLLKVGFPFAIHTNQALYEIQGGYITRPNHENTSWDKAKFEVCAQRWGALKETNFGAVLLNDCKYGYEALNNELRLTLFKAPAGPDPTADRGVHVFTYSLLAFNGDLVESQVTEMAQRLNCSYLLSEGESISTSSSFLEIDKKGIELLTVKQAEDDQSVVIRLNECYGRRISTTLKFSQKISEILKVNMIEEEISVLGHNIDRIQVVFKPFSIITLKLLF